MEESYRMYLHIDRKGRKVEYYLLYRKCENKITNWRVRTGILILTLPVIGSSATLEWVPFLLRGIFPT